MVAYRRDEIVSATELARNLSSTLASLLDKRKEKIAIAKNNRLEAVILDIEEYERLKEAAELLEHIEIGKIVEARKDSPATSYRTLEEAAKELGIDIDAL